MIFAGLMSGTSLDGMDGALIRVHQAAPGQYPKADFQSFSNLSIAYSDAERAALGMAVQDALQWQFEGHEPASFQYAADLLAGKGAEVIQALIERNGLALHDVTAIGFHGQTVLHQPPVQGCAGQTRQIGNGHHLANETGLRVVHDLRSADMRAGGHGAPLAPAWHFELLQENEKPSVFVNIGGVANITFIPEDMRDSMRAFDCGPGNGPLDAWVQESGLGQMDVDGKQSASGKVDAALVTTALENLPKIDGPASFDRWDFDWRMVRGLSPQDGAATLAAISIAAIVRSIQSLGPVPQQVVVGGGGRLNPAIMGGLQAQLPMPVQACEALGMDGDAVEAQAFAWLAALKLADLPNSWPGTTGAKAPVVGGVICDPSSST